MIYVFRITLCKDKSLIEMERLRQCVRAARYYWQHRLMRKIRLERQVLAFIDETAVTIMMPRLRGSSLRACEELG